MVIGRLTPDRERDWWKAHVLETQRILARVPVLLTPGERVMAIGEQAMAIRYVRCDYCGRHQLPPVIDCRCLSCGAPLPPRVSPVPRFIEVTTHTDRERTFIELKDNL